MENLSARQAYTNLAVLMATLIALALLAVSNPAPWSPMGQAEGDNPPPVRNTRVDDRPAVQA